MSLKADGYKSPSDETIIELDVINNGSIVRKAFLIESVLNLFTVPLITHPYRVLSYLLISPTKITPATVFWSRSLGVFIVGALTSAIWTCIPNTKSAIESRRTIYLTLWLGEIALMLLLGLEASKGGGRDAALSVNTSLFSIASLAPLLLWRTYVLFIKPEMIGRYREVSDSNIMLQMLSALVMLLSN